MASASSLTLRVLRFALPIGILAYLFHSMDAHQWEALKSQPKDFPLLAAALGVALLAISLSFLRWAVLVRCLGIPLHLIEAFRLGAIGFLLSFVSAGSVGGDLFKAIFLAGRAKGQRVEAVASVAVDRVLGLHGLLVVGAIALSLVSIDSSSGPLLILRHGAVTGAAVVSGLLLALVVGGRRLQSQLQGIERYPALGRIFHRVADPLTVFHSRPWALVAGVAISLSVHTLLTVSLYLIARALYSAPPTLAEHFLIAPAALLASALPITPAGLGVFEAAFEQLYRWVPEPDTAASGTLVALTFEVVRVVIAGIGIIFYWTAGSEVRRSLDQAEAIDSSEGI